MRFGHILGFRSTCRGSCRWILPVALVSLGGAEAEEPGQPPSRATVPDTSDVDAYARTNPTADPRPGGDAGNPMDSLSTWGRDTFFAPIPLGFGKARLTVASPLLYDAGGFLGLRPATPENATVKVGDFYLKVASVSGSMLHSDNVSWSATNPESGSIAILRLGAVAMYQLAENLHLAVEGKLVYLPKEGRAGISGFGIQDPLYAFSTRPIFEARMAYELQAGEWEVRFADEFRITAGIAAPEGLGFDFREQSAVGQYVFHDQLRPLGLEDPFLVKENRSGASVSRLLPTETRFTLGASRSYYWYDGTLASLYPGRRDTGYVALDSERSDLRLNPFALYKVDRYDFTEYDHQQVRAGVRGSMTENLAVLADGGYCWQDGIGRRDWLWDAQVQHEVSSRIRHRIGYGRYVSEPYGEVEERAMYSIRKELNSVFSLGANAYMSRFTVVDPKDLRGSRSGVNFGVRAEAFVDGGFEVGGGWLRETYASAAIGRRDTWVVRGLLRIRTLEAECVYRFQDRAASDPSVQYRENLMTFTLGKSF